MKMKDLEQPNKIWVAGHRGYKAKYPENTLLSFEKAIELGVDMIELDIRLSKDKVMMVMHDENIDTTTDGFGSLSSYTCSELKKFNAAAKASSDIKKLEIPRFEEVCEMLQSYPDMLLNIEVKYAPDDIEAAKMVVEMTERYSLTDKCVYNSFDANVINYFYDAHLLTHGFPGEKMYNFVSGENGTYSKMWTVAIEMGLLTNEYVKEFHDMGILTWSFCPDNEELMEKSISSGATLATCNDPVPALRLLKEKGLR